MQARYYDPVIGRFYGNDPVDAHGHISRGNLIHGFSRYTYANSNPYKFVDPDGEFGIVGSIIGGIASGAAAYLSGASATDIALAAAGGAVAGAATGGVASVAKLGGMLLNTGMTANMAAGVATSAVTALTAATGNATGQVAGMVLDVVQGNEARSFDSGQMGIPANISSGLFETLITSTSSGLSTGGQIVTGLTGAAIEVSTTLAVQQAEKVYENNE